MDTTLSVALSHQVARRRQMDIIANNIANMSTTAFKRENVMFGQYLQDAEGDMPKAVRQISYVQDYGIARNMSDGNYETTGNVMDIALSGNGLFQVKRDNGEMAYTRNGHFAISDNYTLITSTGEEVMDVSEKSIQLPPGVSNIEISSDGTISSPDTGVIAKLNVVTFTDTSKMKKIGRNMFNADVPVIPATDYQITQGVAETSNVQPVVEVTRMIDVSRSYIQTSKIMEKLQDMRSKAINQLAKVG
ncbi:flagellar hook-basal body complex protein [Paremcibacter congregatus]|uniref:flagellar hook-basal body complex protein n=1 Tax=Paremcibacter congregatus TaxID=2043170 RepID=UPI0030ED0F7C|tara:strand:+ start:567 stop:1307 length:741 start_codon:yes stop_codon:yes gene_type:complete